MSTSEKSILSNIVKVNEKIVQVNTDIVKILKNKIQQQSQPIAATKNQRPRNFFSANQMNQRNLRRNTAQINNE